MEVRELRDCLPCNQCCPNPDPTEVIGYELVLGFITMDKPMVIAMLGNATEFLAYVAKELRARNFHLTKYSKGYKLDPDISEHC